jgi:phenylalanine-4-hydroxylase
MAIRKGGVKGLQKLINSKNRGTIELSTGIQISGVFTQVIADENNKPIYFQTAGLTALSNRDKELIGHGVEKHPNGFGSPIGKLKGINIPIENMSPRDLEAYQIFEGKKVSLEFEGGIKVAGDIITGTRDLSGKILLISIENCTVSYKETILFKPEDGIYNMAVGKEVISAFAGAADISSFQDEGEVSKTKTRKIRYTNKEKELYALYEEVRKMRKANNISEKNMIIILDQLKKDFPDDWLLSLELYEVALQYHFLVQKEILKYLLIMQKNERYYNLIRNGLNLLKVKK